jgi:ABC-type antimicrobial peptide transport system permease subunit
MMMRIAERLARASKALALVTGDVVGQVASQTLENLAVVSSAATLPIFRPLIGMDKEEITAQAIAIGSYPISIIPDQDCCTLFTPRNPLTKARLAQIEAAETALPVEALVDRATAPRRFIALVLAGFALFALLLASLGVYAVVAYRVSRRKQEFGIRLALGASAADIQRHVLWGTLRLAIAGLVLGLPAAWIVSRLMRDLLFGVTPADPTTFGGMIATLGATALVAAYLPARRASRLDPTRTLRGVD